MEVIKLREKRFFYLTDEDLEVAVSNGLNPLTVKNRVYRDGWEINRAITQPAQKRDKTCRGWNNWKDKAIVGKSTYLERMRTGWDQEKAALTPVMTPAQAAKLKRKYSEEHEAIAASNGVSPGCMRYRVSQMGWSIEKAINTPPMNKSQVGKIAMNKRWKNGK